MINKIEALNKTIDNLMREKNKADAQKEVWEKRLHESIVGYKKEYGVDLSAKTFSGIKEKLSTEMKEVESQTMAEYEQAQKLVSLIQSGDISGAWRELGVDIEEKSEEPEEVIDKPSGLDIGKQEQSEQIALQGVTEAIMDIEDDFSDDDLFGAGVSEEKEAEDEVVAKPVVDFGFDDDDDDEFVIPSTKEHEDEKGDSDSGIALEDDDDDPFGSFGGFGNILEGSKFKV